MIHTTLTGNLAANGGGLLNDTALIDSAVITNSIIAGNFAPAGRDVSNLANRYLAFEGQNLIGNKGFNSAGPVTGTEGEEIFYVEPDTLFHKTIEHGQGGASAYWAGVLGNNGGTGPSIAIKIGGPAHNRIAPALVPPDIAGFNPNNNDPLPFDGRGLLRTNGGFADIGAFEIQEDPPRLLSGTKAADALYGSVDNDRMIGGKGRDLLSGGAGTDTAVYKLGRKGKIDLRKTWAQKTGEGRDVLIGIENLTSGKRRQKLIGDENANLLQAGLGRDVLKGKQGDDFLKGGWGKDKIKGGQGSDTAIYSAKKGVKVNLSKSSWQKTGQGKDKLKSIENLRSGEGNDILIGNKAANILEGGTGNDKLHGKAGSDTASYQYAGTAVNVTLTSTAWQETGGAGRDKLRSIENLRGSAHADLLQGNSKKNKLRGLDGDDRLEGGAGNDVLEGGAGDDLLLGGSGGDRLDGGAGRDTASYADAPDAVSADLSGVVANTGHAQNDVFIDIENLQGSAFDDFLYGDDGDNRLDGGANEDGGDTMAGGAGDDVYLVDSDLDTIIELVDGGTDTVMAGISYVLSEELENLTLTGTENINATGNRSDNVITGNSGNNILLGGDSTDQGADGIDVLIGGEGDDFYVLFDTGDRVIEAANEGVDSIWSFLSSYTLDQNVENLNLVGGAISGVGNELDNEMYGNELDNNLTGGNGEDILIGHAGADTLTGGNQADIFRFERITDFGNSSNVHDRITDFLAGEDRIDLTGIDAVSGGPLGESFNWIGTSAFTGSPGDLRFEQINLGTDTKVAGDVDSDQIADFELILTGNIGLQASDFLL